MSDRIIATAPQQIPGLYRTLNIKFKGFPGPNSFSQTCQVLEILQKNPRTFQEVWKPRVNDYDIQRPSSILFTFNGLLNFLIILSASSYFDSQTNTSFSGISVNRLVQYSLYDRTAQRPTMLDAGTVCSRGMRITSFL